MNNTKRPFEKAEAEIVTLDNIDIVTASLTNSFDGDDHVFPNN